MLLKDFSLPSPQENLLYDELLLQLAEKQSAGEVLRFWESPSVFIVLGSIGKEDDDVYLEEALRDNVSVLRRTSGGGTVVQGPGCLNYTFVLDKNRHPDLYDLRKSYVWISSKVIEALKRCGVEAVFKPISDIATLSSDKKISGNAQHRGKNYILHHGTILCDFDLNLINRYLKMPKDIPEYRKNRSHDSFVSNSNIDKNQFKEALAATFGLEFNKTLQHIDSKELSALLELISKRSLIIQ